MKKNNPERSPQLWSMYLTDVWANNGGGWRSLPREVSHSEAFLGLSDQAARLMIYLWDLVWVDKENKDLLNNGVVSMPKNRMIAIGLREESIESVKNEIVNARFFTEIGPYTFRLSEDWRNMN